MTKPRLHLSTWIVLLVAAGVLFAVKNVSPYYSSAGSPKGWPFVASENPFITIGEMEAEPSKIYGRKYYFGNIVCNVGTALTIVIFTGALVETAARRGWLRIHLATLFVLSLVVAGLIGLNMQVRPLNGDRWIKGYGWPVAGIEVHPRRSPFGGAPVGVQPPRIGFPSLSDMRDDERRAFCINLGVGIVVLIATAAFSEIIIRRRKPSTAP